jgi:hypothetical protein
MYKYYQSRALEANNALNQAKQTEAIKESRLIEKEKFKVINA